MYAHRASEPQPLILSHRLIEIGSECYHVVSRICEAGLDFTHRSNFLAHHVVFEPGETGLDFSPAEMLLGWNEWFNRWEQEPAELPSIDPHSLSSLLEPLNPPCTTWSSLTGDAGWAAFPLKFREGACWKFQHISELDLLRLMGESLRLRAEGRMEKLWDISFTTFNGSILEPSRFFWSAWNAVDKPPFEKQSVLSLVEPESLQGIPSGEPSAIRSAREGLQKSKNKKEIPNEVDSIRAPIRVKEIPERKTFLSGKQISRVRPPTNPKKSKILLALPMLPVIIITSLLIKQKIDQKNKEEIENTFEAIKQDRFKNHPKEKINTKNVDFFNSLDKELNQKRPDPEEIKKLFISRYGENWREIREGFVKKAREKEYTITEIEKKYIKTKIEEETKKINEVNIQFIGLDKIIQNIEFYQDTYNKRYNEEIGAEEIKWFRKLKKIADLTGNEENFEAILNDFEDDSEHQKFILSAKKNEILRFLRGKKTEKNYPDENPVKLRPVAPESPLLPYARVQEHILLSLLQCSESEKEKMLSLSRIKEKPLWIFFGQAEQIKTLDQEEDLQQYQISNKNLAKTEPKWSEVFRKKKNKISVRNPIENERKSLLLISPKKNILILPQKALYLSIKETEFNEQFIKELQEFAEQQIATDVNQNAGTEWHVKLAQAPEIICTYKKISDVDISNILTNLNTKIQENLEAKANQIGLTVNEIDNIFGEPRNSWIKPFLSPKPDDLKKWDKEIEQITKGEINKISQETKLVDGKNSEPEFIKKQTTSSEILKPYNNDPSSLNEFLNIANEQINLIRKTLGIRKLSKKIQEIEFNDYEKESFTTLSSKRASLSAFSDVLVLKKLKITDPKKIHDPSYVQISLWMIGDALTEIIILNITP